MSTASAARADMSGKVDVRAAELAAEFIGAPVLARDGEQVGNVAHLSFDDEGQPLALRMRTSLSLGLGTRTIHLPNCTFLVLRGLVMLEIPAEAVQSLAELGRVLNYEPTWPCHANGLGTVDLPPIGDHSKLRAYSDEVGRGFRAKAATHSN